MDFLATIYPPAVIFIKTKGYLKVYATIALLTTIFLQRKAAVWKRSDFQQLKQDLAQQIARDYPSDGPSEQRLAYFLGQVSRYKDQLTDQTTMQTYLYAMFALNFHLQSGGLKETQLKDLLNLSEAMLTIGGVKARTSTLAYLYGEIHLVSSQLHVLNGEALLASWEQQIALHLSGSQPPGGWDYQSLLAGMQSMRLGFAGLATEDFSKVWQNSTDQTLRSRAGIHLLRCLRFSGQVEEAEQLDAEIRQLSLSEKGQLELDWEHACRRMLKLHDAEEIFHLIRRGKNHYRPSYVLEAFFWARAVSSLEWLSRLPKLKTLRQRKDFNFAHYAVFYRCAQDLEQASDTEIPLQHRLQHAKRILSALSELQDIDKHLLALAALLRWLIRSNYRRLARLLYAEYCAISQRLSIGRNSDALGIFSDAQQKPWLQDLETSD